MFKTYFSNKKIHTKIRIKESPLAFECSFKIKMKQRRKIDLLRSMRGGGRYLSPGWLQKTGIEPRMITNESVCPSYTSIILVNREFDLVSTLLLKQKKPYLFGFDKISHITVLINPASFESRA